jgi:hypothetical protein
VRDFYRDEQYLDKTAKVASWNESYVNEFIERYKSGNALYNYGNGTAFSLGRHLRQLKIQGK